MSTTSTATALEALDHTLGNETELLNCMCILVLTKANCTLFNTASIQEEAIIELYVGVGQMYP